MRIAGNKPDPTNLADIVSSMDGEANGFVDDVVVGIPPEVVPPEPVVTSPAVIKAEKRGRKPKSIPATAKPLGPALSSPDEMNDGTAPTPNAPAPAFTGPDDQAEFAQEDAAQTAQGKSKPVIEHGIPIPAHGNVGAVRYPFREMKKGDSFFVRQEPGESRKKLSARVRSASAQFRRRSTGEVVSFTTRMEKNGIRVWRLT